MVAKNKNKQKPLLKVGDAQPDGFKKSFSELGGLKLGTPMKIEEVKFASGVREPGYVAMFEELKKLKKGECLPIPVPTGITQEAMLNRLTAALQRGKTTGDCVPPAGCRFLKGKLDNGDIAIKCVPVSG